MARQKGSANFSGTLEVLAGGPIDARSVVPTLADLTVAANFPYPYVGMETYVVSENKKYRLIVADVTSSSNWEEVGSGGGGGGEDGGKMLTGTLLAASWSSKAQTVSVTGLKSDTIGAIGILNTATATQIAAAREAVITPTTLANGTISFTCENVPSVDIPFGVLIPGGGSGGGSGVPEGGTTGQVLAKKSSADGDAEWVNPVSTSDCYKTGDTAETALADNDKIPFYDTSASGKRSSTWSNIKSVLKTYFDTLYSTVKTKGTPTSGGTALSLVTTGDMYNWNNPSLPIVANQFDKANIYSTTEKIVGCWTDGRPVYQKVISGNLNPTSTLGTEETTEIQIGASVDTFVKYSLFVNNNEGYQPVYTQIPNDSKDLHLRVAFNTNRRSSNPNTILLRNSNYNTSTTYICIVQYTKTTDSANSFNYADENDYSTTEHIVGKWTDGKPVYQKTFTGTFTLTANTEYAFVIATGIKNALRGSGFIKFSNNYEMTVPCDTSTNYSQLMKDPSGDLYLTVKGTSGGSTAYNVTIQYTKTTD